MWGSAATYSAISTACQACCWIHGRHFTGEYTFKHTFKHTLREVPGDCQGARRKRKQVKNLSPREKKTKQALSPSLSFSLSVIDGVLSRESPGRYSPLLHGCLPIGIPLQWNPTHRNTQVHGDMSPAWHTRLQSTCALRHTVPEGELIIFPFTPSVSVNSQATAIIYSTSRV